MRRGFLDTYSVAPYWSLKNKHTVNTDSTLLVAPPVRLRVLGRSDPNDSPEFIRALTLLAQRDSC